MDDAKAFIRLLFDRVAAKELDGVAEMFAEDAVFVDAADPAQVEGRAAIRDMVADMWTGLPDFHVERIVTMVADGNTVMAELDLLGSHQGKYLGYQPTGNRIEWSTAVLYELNEEGDQIVREAYYYDSAGLLAQLAGEKA